MHVFMFYVAHVQYIWVCSTNMGIAVIFDTCTLPALAYKIVTVHYLQKCILVPVHCTLPSEYTMVPEHCALPAEVHNGTCTLYTTCRVHNGHCTLPAEVHNGPCTLELLDSSHEGTASFMS